VLIGEFFTMIVLLKDLFRLNSRDATLSKF